jgi:hypothetical protein
MTLPFAVDISSCFPAVMIAQIDSSPTAVDMPDGVPHHIVIRLYFQEWDPLVFRGNADSALWGQNELTWSK